MTGTVKRSISTPNVLQAAAVSMMEGTQGYPSADKRRNKLGYHRTSVACGHCRRRKIRCLLAKDDAQGRCSNCIRLKKECNFYPVDSADRRPRSSSKTDASGNHEPSSANSSPSPRHGELMRLQFPPHAMDNPRGYPASVPVTPTGEYPNAFEESFHQGSYPGSTKRGRTPSSQSRNVSRRPSLAQMHVMPLSMKMESGIILPNEGYRQHRWEANPSQADPSMSIPGQMIASQEYPDPSTTYWRMEGNDMTTGPFITPQPSIDRFRSYNSLEEIPDGRWASQVPSRVGSIDLSIGTGYPYGPAYSSDAEFTAPPSLCSASTSTASLTASLTEASQYGGEIRPEGQFYMNPWASRSTPGYHSSGLLKQDQYDEGVAIFPPTNEPQFAHVTEEPSFAFQPPNYSPAAQVNMTEP